VQLPIVAFVVVAVAVVVVVVVVVAVLDAGLAMLTQNEREERWQ